MAVNTLFLQNQSALGVKVSDTWNKSAQLISRPLGKARPLLLPWVIPNLSDTNEDDGISNVFTATVDPIDGGLETVDDKKDLVDSKFEKMDDQDDIHIAYEKLY